MADYSYIVYLITSVIRITRVHRINDCCSLILITLITQLMTACVSLTSLHHIPQIKRPPLTHTLQNCTQFQALALIKVPSRDHVQWCLVSIICDHRQKKEVYSIDWQQVLRNFVETVENWWKMTLTLQTVLKSYEFFFPLSWIFLANTWLNVFFPTANLNIPFSFLRLKLCKKNCLFIIH